MLRVNTKLMRAIVAGPHPASITYVYVVDEGSFLKGMSRDLPSPGTRVFNIYIIYLFININIYVENMLRESGGE